MNEMARSLSMSQKKTIGLANENQTLENSEYTIKQCLNTNFKGFVIFEYASGEPEGNTNRNHILIRLHFKI